MNDLKYSLMAVIGFLIGICFVLLAISFNVPIIAVFLTVLGTILMGLSVYYLNKMFYKYFYIYEPEGEDKK